MRVRTGHKPDDWEDRGPSEAHLTGIRGALVVAPSPKSGAQRQSEHKAAKKVAA